MRTSTILVIRATGSQGLAVCRHLRELGFNVHGLVRDASDKRTLPLKSLGVTLFEGSEDDCEAIDRAMAGCRGLFLNLMPNLTQDGFKVQPEKILLKAAKAAGVDHVVCSTSIAVPEEAPLEINVNDTIESKVTLAKYFMEQEVKDAGLKSWTILRPAFFMTNFFWPLGDAIFPELAFRGEFVTSYHADTILPLIDPNDIGIFAAAAFKDPKRFGGETIGLAAEKLTVEMCVQLLQSASGSQIKQIYRTEEETEILAKVNPIVANQRKTRDIHTKVDLETPGTFGIQLGSFQNFLTRERDLVRKSFQEKDNHQVKLF